MDENRYHELLGAKARWWHAAIHGLILILALGGATAVGLFVCSTLPVAQQWLFADEGELLFPVESNAIVLGPAFLLSLPSLHWLITALLRVFPVTGYACDYYEVHYLHIPDFSGYLTVVRRVHRTVLALLLLCSLLCVLCLHYYVRVDSSGIYYSPFLSFYERHYSWDELQSVKVYAAFYAENGRLPRVSPSMDASFGDVVKDLWQEGGLGSPDAQSLIAFVDLAHRWSDAQIVVRIYPGKTMEEALHEACGPAKRETIEAVFAHLQGMCSEPDEADSGSGDPAEQE